MSSADPEDVTVEPTPRPMKAALPPMFGPLVRWKMYDCVSSCWMSQGATRPEPNALAVMVPPPADWTSGMAVNRFTPVTSDAVAAGTSVDSAKSLDCTVHTAARELYWKMAAWLGKLRVNVVPPLDRLK